MKSYVQYIARDVRWYIIVKPHVSYDGGGVPVGGHAKVASRSEDGVVAHVPSYTSMVTYITSYKAISTKLMRWVPSPPARGLLLVFVTGTMKNYTSIEL